MADQLRRDGLEVRLEKVMVPHWVRGLETAELVDLLGMAEGTCQRLAVFEVRFFRVGNPAGYAPRKMPLRDAALGTGDAA